jgi:hypothetical protein
MATRKGVELRTDFTGSDKNFQPVLKRTQRGVKKLGKDAKKAGEEGSRGLDKLKKKLEQVKSTAGKAAIAVAAVTGVVMATRQKNERMSIISQQAGLADMDIESFQRLAHVLKGFRIEADQTAEIVEELRKVAGEALLEPTSEKANAFKMLHIDLLKFMELNPIEQLQQLNEAFNLIRKEEKGEFKASRATDALISDMGMQLKGVMKLPDEEFRRRLVEAGDRIVPEMMVKKGAETFEKQRGQFLGLGKEEYDKFLSTFSAGFDEIKSRPFGALGKRSAFDPSITFDPEGDKAREDADKEAIKEATNLERTLKRVNKNTNPFDLALMGMTVTGGVRPVQNKAVKLQEQTAKNTERAAKAAEETRDWFDING